MIGAAGAAAPPSLAAAGASEFTAAAAVDGSALAGATAGTARAALSGLSLAKRGSTTKEQPEKPSKSSPRQLRVRDLKRFRPWVDQDGWDHILEGDEFGKGGHRPGLGKTGKSEFPAGWTYDKIKLKILEVVSDPDSSIVFQRNGRVAIRGSRDGVDILVAVEGPQDQLYGRIVTAHPENVPLNR